MSANPSGKTPLNAILSWKAILAAFLVTALVGAVLYMALNTFMLSQAEKSIQNVLLDHKGIHHYIQRNTHPALYKLKQQGEVSADFYAPELLSSSYMLRNINNYYNEERAKEGLPPIYYKMAALNPRNPVNRADKLESGLIRMFNRDRSLTHFNEIIEIGGEKYLYYAIPFLATNQACLKCHGRRQDAPRQLQERYQGQGGFGDRAGSIRAIEIVRAPLESVFKTLYLVFVAVLAGVAAFAALFLFNRHLKAVVQHRTDSLQEELHERRRAETALQESREYLRTLVESSMDAIITTDTDREITSCNQAFLKMYGYEEDEVIGCSGRLLHLSDESYDEFGKRVFPEVREKGYWKGEWEFRKKNGAKVSVEVVFSAHRRPDQEAYGFVAIHRDVTERKQVAEALRENQRKLTNLIGNLPGFAYRCKNDPYWTMEFISDGCEAITGYAPSDLLGNRALSFNDLIHPQWREQLWRKWQEVLARREHFEYEYQIIAADGAIKWVWERGLGVFDDRGDLIYLEGFITDITERKQAEEAIRLSEMRLKAILEANPDPVVVYDYAGRTTFVNPAFSRVFGWQAEELLGRRIPFVPGEEEEITRETIHDLAQGDGVVSLETKRLTKGGRAIDVLVSAAGIRGGDGAITGSVVNLTDLTETRQLAAQLRQAQKMEAIGTLASGIAHDFNNILAAVMGFAEMARDDARKGVVNPEDLDQVLTSAHRAKELVQQILTFSRKKEPAAQVLDLNQVVRSAQAIIERTLPKMIEVEIVLENGLPPIMADPTQLEQVLLNLASNAQDAMPDGGKLIIETHKVALDAEDCRRYLEVRAGSYVQLIVTDTGMGIDADAREHIFEPFYTTKDIGKGTGLGLSTAYGIVKNHAGHIHCYSEPGQGTAFGIYLPVLSDQDVESTAEPVQAADTAPGGDETILIADDEKSIRNILARTLEGKGYRVVAAAGGEEAVALYGRMDRSPDLVIMDLGMPGMGGHKAMLAILETAPRAKVIIASGYSATAQVKAALDSGGAGYVAKPFRLGELLRTVRRVLDQGPAEGSA